MIKILKTLFITFIILSGLSSCSYQKINLADNSFTIKELNVNGDKRTSFLVEKKIKKFSQKDGLENLAISINLNTKRNIHEKDIKNKVTKYKLTLTAEVEIKNLNKLDILKRSYTSSVIYNVANKYTDTANNRKKANTELIDMIVDQLIDELKISYN